MLCLPSCESADNLLRIHRPETEIWTTHLADRLLSKSSGVRTARDSTIRILDLCTGTGCISLLLHSLLHRSLLSLEILGIDLLAGAINLAQRNLYHNVSKRLLPPSASSQVLFAEADLFKSEEIWHKIGGGEWDVVVSNPPYISPQAYNHTTTRAVRNWEPKTALVPPSSSASFRTGDEGSSLSDASIGDRFYPRILDLAGKSGARMVAMEVGDMAQAERVAALVLQSKEWSRCEIWRDGLSTVQGTIETQIIQGEEVVVRGQDNGRVVMGWRRLVAC
ncbi:MAG: hypothetical protein Q9196_003004 [Gyalolechia fulgens]